MDFRGRGSQAEPVDGWGVLLFSGGDGTVPGAPGRAAARAAPGTEEVCMGDWSTWLVCGALARICKGQKGSFRADLLEAAVQHSMCPAWT